MSAEIQNATAQRFVEVVNRGDTDAFLALFPQDGVVDDWGRRFVGHEAIRGWSDKEFIGAKGRMDVTNVEEAEDEVRITADWTSNHYTGPSLFVLTLQGEQVQEMGIADAS